MKKLTPFIALAALLAVVGCGGDSPSASPVPTVVPESWAIPRLAVSSGQVFVGTPVQVDIDVTRNGSPAPDGTVIELLSSGPGALFGFTRGNLTAEKGFIELRRDAQVVTEGGSATVFFLVADDPDQEGDQSDGSYTIQARVRTALRSTSVSYLPVAAGDSLVLTSINPDRGPYSGGQTVTIFGVNIEAPVEVFFFLNGRPYAAEIVNVVEGYDGWIVVITPAFTGEDSSIEQRADVRVTVGLGSDNEQVGRLLQAYTLLPSSQTSGPVIFGVSPTS
nr:hypothetical protein [Thermoanaerobaculales bacterium]